MFRGFADSVVSLPVCAELVSSQSSLFFNYSFFRNLPSKFKERQLGVLVKELSKGKKVERMIERI